MSGIVIYTVLTGGYDELVEPAFKSDQCDYICLTDSTRLVSRGWKVVHVPRLWLGAERRSRHPKILPHLYFPEYETSVYVDANMEIRGDFSNLVDEALDAEHAVAMFKHPERNCIYDEGEACVRERRETRRTVSGQLARYRVSGYPAGHGLVAGGIILRRHNDPAVQAAMEEWWHEVSLFSHRDQLSFNYIAWKQGLHVRVIDGNIRNNSYAAIVETHRRRALKQAWDWANRNRSGNILAAGCVIVGNVILRASRGVYHD